MRDYIRCQKCSYVNTYDLQKEIKKRNRLNKGNELLVNQAIMYSLICLKCDELLRHK